MHSRIQPTISGTRRLSDAVIFLVPASIWIQPNAAGILFATDLLLLLLLPLLLTERPALRLVPAAKLIVLFGLFWLFGQVFTDIYRQTSYHDLERGWANIALSITNFVAIYLLLGTSPRRLTIFAVGLCIGLAIESFVHPSSLADQWKFGLAFPVTLAAALLVSTRKSASVPLLPSLTLGVMGILNLFLGFRSLGGICFLAAAYLCLHQLRSTRPTMWSHTKLTWGVAVGVVLSAAVIAIYDRAAQSNLLGEEARSKHAAQSRGRFGVFLAGRPESLASSAAIADSPIIGHGSWARDPHYASLLASKLTSLGYRSLPRVNEPDLIPTHSHLLGAWVNAGILGAVYWCIILSLSLTTLTQIYRADIPLVPLVALVAMLLCWDILFSPYSAEQRVLVPFSIVLLLAARSWSSKAPAST